MEYYDNERKWKSKATPKRTIILEKCFNINRKCDTRDARNKFVIALYTLDDCVSIVFDTENELNEWLDILLTLQQASIYFLTLFDTGKYVCILFYKIYILVVTSHFNRVNTHF